MISRISFTPSGDTSRIISTRHATVSHRKSSLIANSPRSIQILIKSLISKLQTFQTSIPIGSWDNSQPFVPFMQI